MVISVKKIVLNNMSGYFRLNCRYFLEFSGGRVTTSYVNPKTGQKEKLGSLIKASF